MPSPSLFLGSSTTLITVLSLLSSTVLSNPLRRQTSTQTYQIDTVYQGATFFDGFNFFNGADPTHGYVTYRDQAGSANLISSGAGQDAIMRVDNTTVLTQTTGYYNVDGIGRQSVRIQSQKSWTHALIIADIPHMPSSSTGGCGTWPAFWTLGPNWPSNGEYDILEGANAQQTAFSAGHTGHTCSANNAGAQGSVLSDSNCDLYDSNGNATNSVGCKITADSTQTYGEGFNAGQGGVYAMEWTSNHIATYFFPRGQIPNDITSGNPQPNNWTPLAVIGSGGCNIDENFASMSILFDTTFCGDFGDATWTGTCSQNTGYTTCANYVAANPHDFSSTYWQISSVKVYTLQNAPISTTSTSTSTTSTSSSTTSSTTTTTTSSTTSSSSATWNRTSSSTSWTGTVNGSSSWPTNTISNSYNTWAQTTSTGIASASSSQSWPNDPKKQYTTTSSSVSQTWASWLADPTTTTTTSVSQTWASWSADPTTTTTTQATWASWSADPKTTTTTTTAASWSDWSASSSNGGNWNAPTGASSPASPGSWTTGYGGSQVSAVGGATSAAAAPWTSGNGGSQVNAATGAVSSATWASANGNSQVNAVTGATTVSVIPTAPASSGAGVWAAQANGGSASSAANAAATSNAWGVGAVGANGTSTGAWASTYTGGASSRFVVSLSTGLFGVVMAVVLVL